MREALDDAALAKEWEPSDHRGFLVLAGLALLSAICGFIAFRELDDVRWLLGALVIIASWPYTYFAIVPLNNRILALIGGEAAHEARNVIKLWGQLAGAGSDRHRRADGGTFSLGRELILASTLRAAAR